MRGRLEGRRLEVPAAGRNPWCEEPWSCGPSVAASALRRRAGTVPMMGLKGLAVGADRKTAALRAHRHVPYYPRAGADRKTAALRAPPVGYP